MSDWSNTPQYPWENGAQTPAQGADNGFRTPEQPSRQEGDFSDAPAQEGQATEQGTFSAPETQASFGSAGWQETQSFSSESPAPKQKKHRIGKFLLGALAVLLAAGICFGAGYAGILVASQRKGKVILQQITAPEQSDSSALPSAGSGLSAAQIAAKVEHSVVAITTEIMTTGNYWFGNYVTSGAGSGIIISEDGYILTCAHVISGASKIAVELKDGSKYDAELVGSYVDGDIAVVKIEASGLTPAQIADSNQVVQGAECYAVGNPEGRFSGSISDGIVSALNRTISVQVEENRSSGNSLYDMFYGGFNSGRMIQLNVLQITAAVSPGNSGGALFNDQGQLIGVVSAKSSDTQSEGLGFAIPSNTALEISSQLIANGSYDGGDTSGNQTVTPTGNKAVLGITVTTVTAQNSAQYNGLAPGVYVSAISEKSTEKAGLAVGDRIISVDDVMVSAATDITDYLAEKQPGDVVRLNVERSGKLVSLEITLLENTQAQ